MKTAVYFLAAALLLASCAKKSGKVLYNINFTTQHIVLKTDETASDSTYTQFGDYITSVTPAKFTAHMWTIGYIDKVLNFSNNEANMLQYIEQNGSKLPTGDPSRFIDFSNNNVVSFSPVVYGNLRDEKAGIFATPQIDFKYFYFMPFNIKQQVPLPPQYNGTALDMFPNAVADNNTLKVDYYEMMAKIFPNANTHNIMYFIFGNTDSTFLVNPNGETVTLSENCPIAEPGQSLVIRSNNYRNMIFNSPVDGGTVTMNGTVSFNTTNLIQFYAGADNIPYTADDVMVYAPRFWERMLCKLDVN